MSETHHGSLSRIEIENNNKRALTVCPCFCEKTYLMMKKFYQVSLIIQIGKTSLTRSSNQYPDYDTEEQVCTNDENKDCVVAFEEVLEKKQKDISPFFTHGWHENTVVYCLSERYFELPLAIRDKRNFINFFEQIPKTVQCSFSDIDGSDMNCEDFKQFFKEAWKQKNISLKIKRLDDEEKFVFVVKAKKTINYINL